MLQRPVLIPVIAAASALAALLLALLLRLFLRKRRVASASPLPPVQALAHHRQLQLTKLDRTWLLVPSSASLPLPLPTPSFHRVPRSPASSSSLVSDDSSPISTPRSAHRRPLSLISSHSTLRGTPHGPHSQMQIILPTPLAPIRDAPHRLARRNSAVDQWLHVTTHDPPHPDRPLPITE